MKPSTLINKVAEVIEALEPSDTASSVDRFARVTGRQHDEALHGRRLFALRWSDPLPQTPSGTAISCSRYQAGLELAIGYADTAAAQGRLGDDALLVTDALLSLPTSIPSANITDIELSSSSDADSVEGAVLAFYRIQFEFYGA